MISIIFLLIILNGAFSLSLKRLSWTNHMDDTWKWNNHCINYVKNTSADNKKALLLIHGFGSSCYHWRCNILNLPDEYDVYAFDLLGFGKSSKPDENYDLNLWCDQTNDFIENVIQKDTIIIGNSLGGSIALNSSKNKKVNGVILLNSYLRFKNKPNLKVPKFVIKLITRFYFNFIRRENKISDTLHILYPENPEKVTQCLIDSITEPTNDPNALKVLTNIIENIICSQKDDSEEILCNFNKPLFLIWGLQDKWINRSMADKIIELHPHTETQFINAGHCPQDEVPELVNDLISKFLKKKFTN